MSLPARSMVNLAAVGFIVAAGVVHGRWTGRWVVSHDLEEAVARLSALPERIGDWTSRPFDLDARQVELAGISGYLARRYESKAHDGLTVLLVCGPPGPIAVHTPDVCYRGAGYEPEAFPIASEVAYGEPPRAARLFEGIYRKKSAAGPEVLRVAWAYQSRGTWDAPANPRLTYAMQRALYKLYVVQDVGSGDVSRSRAVLTDFARVLLPALDRALAPRPVVAGTSVVPPGSPPRVAGRRD